ncbi:ABC transporter permease [Nocardioides sp. KR10-350]|uniref:ABC transporter permease n=1 Tax=Nocardioides cheoyonin TaxID=3156615 RepID=UPI0032B54970
MTAATAELPDLTLDRVLSPRPSPGDAVRQTLAFAWRALLKMRRNPEQFMDVTLQPLLFTAMFTYIFGGAISGSVSDYMPTIIPGILAQTAITTCMATGTQLREDMDKGVFDRFKSLPIARIAPLAGPAIADILRYVIAATLTILVGIAMGYRPGGGVGGTIAGWALTIIAAWSLAWIFTWLGTVMRTAQAVQGTAMLIMFPLSFMSNAFVDPDTMPGWLQGFVKVNPLSHVVTAVRDLINNGSFTGEVGWALLGCAIVVAIFLPLSVRSYSRKM